MEKKKVSTVHICTSCGGGYRKKDFDLCPFCGGDGGAVTTRPWKPSKYQKKDFIKKMKSQE